MANRVGITSETKFSEEPLKIIVCASCDHNRNLTTEDNDQSGLERAEDSREPN